MPENGSPDILESWFCDMLRYSRDLPRPEKLLPCNEVIWFPPMLNLRSDNILMNISSGSSVISFMSRVREESLYICCKDDSSEVGILLFASDNVVSVS